MPKRHWKRIRTPPTSSDSEEDELPTKKVKLVDYSDTDDSDDDDEFPPPPRKRPMVIYSDDEEEDYHQYYTITPVRERESRRFRTRANVYNVDVNKFPDHVSPLEFVPRMFQQLVNDIKTHSQAQGNDRIRISIYHPGLKLGIFVPFTDVASLTGESLTQEIEKVLQSNEDFKINDGQMSLKVTHTKLPSGGGRKALHHGLYFESRNMRKMKHSIVQINNTKDAMCMARAIVVGKHHADRDDSDLWKKTWHHIRNSDRPLQTREAIKLLDHAGIPHSTPCGWEEYKKIQTVLAPEYLIKVHSQHPKDGLLFQTGFKPSEKTKVIHIYFNGKDHYDTITNIKGFQGCSYYCEFCDQGYNHRGDHACPNGCTSCYSPTPCLHEQNQYCVKCKRTFHSASCFANHTLVKPGQKKSICQLVFNCEKCGNRIVENKRNHVCPGQKKCRICKKIVGPEHQCYIQPYVCKQKTEVLQEDAEEDDIIDEEKGTVIQPQFIFFDFESKQDSGEHMVNFCIAQRACDDCMDLPIEQPCKNCNKITHKVCDQCVNLPVDQYCNICSQFGREMIFEGDNTLSDFCSWLFRKENEGVTVIAHNFGGNDGQFILRHILENGTFKPEVIMNGNTIVTMTAANVKFLDSYHFLHMRLANFPDTFGLTEMKKGYFPHLANIDANQNYVGPYFPVEMYNPGQMSVKDREAFLEWHKQKVEFNAIFDFRREMEEYCRSDVDILRRGCACFRKQLMNISDLDPFANACTIAQACSQVWRKNHMPENSVAIIPPEGYPNQKKYSIKAVRWIQGMARKNHIKIRHALNGGEQKVCGHYVDGYDPETKTVYEFHGCYWHGCPKHFPDRTKINTYSCLTMYELYKQTVEKTEKLKRAGYQVTEMWECEYDRLYQDDQDFKKMVDAEFTNLDPLKPRDALFGGRTNSTRLFYEIDKTTDEEIKYIDVCSLYPFICKYGIFPVGHPEICSQEDIDRDNIQQYFGLIKCKVLPPRDLYHPVLPYKCNKKLLFPLCRSCAETSDNSNLCTHDREEDRELIGTWVSIELFEAMKLGYQLKDVYEIWHFPQSSQYDKSTGQGGIFAGYIDTFLKIKQESSGYPDWCKTEADKIKFKQDYYEAEGIRLENVEKNKGRRGISKISLNSLWGKLAQRDNMTKTEYVSDPSVYFELVTNPLKKVKNVEVFGEQFLLINWEDLESIVEPHACSNVVVGSFVTAQARLKLYGVLHQLDKRVLYFDTDSIIYIHKPELWNPEIINNRLGEWTDEMPTAKITKFVGMGPKNYGYEYVEHDTGKLKSTCKVKGLTLDYNTSQVIHFYNMIEWATSDKRDFRESVEYQHRIRKHKDRKITTERQSKMYRFTYDKRVILKNGETVPYGYLL